MVLPYNVSLYSLVFLFISCFSASCRNTLEASEWSPQTPTRALPLDPTGGLLSHRLPASAPLKSKPCFLCSCTLFYCNGGCREWYRKMWIYIAHRCRNLNVLYMSVLWKQESLKETSKRSRIHWMLQCRWANNWESLMAIISKVVGWYNQLVSRSTILELVEAAGTR